MIVVQFKELGVVKVLAFLETISPLWLLEIDWVGISREQFRFIPTSRKFPE